MSLNWDIEVFIAFLGFIFFLIFSSISFKLAYSRKDKVFLSLALTLSIFTLFNLLEATAYLFLNFELKRASAIMYSLGLFSLILNVDLVSKERISYYKSVGASFLIGCTIILAFIPGNIQFYYHPIWGYPTLGVSGLLRIFNNFALFLVGFQLSYWFYRTWRKSPPELKKSALKIFTTAILFFITILIIFLSGIYLIIPIGYIIAAGFMSFVMYFVICEPKLINILSFSVYRITVIANHSGSPLFNLSWNFNDDTSKHEQNILAKWLPALQQVSFNYTKSLIVEEIKLERDILLFTQGNYVTAVLLSKHSTPAIRESLDNFVKVFEQHYFALLDSHQTNSSLYNKANELINKFFPIGVSSNSNSDTSLNSYLEELVNLRTRELEQISQFKTEFLSRMSHELRTPLNVIIGFTDILLENLYGEVNEEQRKFLKNISSSSTDLLDLINDILDISRIESGKIKLFLTEISLNDMLFQIKSSVKPLYKDKKLKFKILGINHNQKVMADPIRFKEILYNLISNAIKYTIKGEITLKFSETKEYWNFEVKDTGIGIAEKHYPLLFRDFQRIDSGYVKSIPGTGLGLSLTKRLVNLHGGNIWFTSELGKGTIFTFTLPKNKPIEKEYA